MIRSRARGMSVAVAALALLGGSLTQVPAAIALEGQESTPATSETSEPAPSPAPSSSPSPSIAPEPSPKPSPDASTTPSTSPDPGTSPSASASASPSPSSTSSPTPSTSASWIECDGDLDTCPPAPRLLTATETSTSVELKWEWPSATDPDASVTGVLVRATPGDLEFVFDADAVSGTLTDLDPETTYLISAHGLDDKRLSVASNVLDVTTLSSTMKPMAQAGDISRLIINTRSDADPGSAAAGAAADLPVDGVAVETVRELGETNVVIELDSGVSEGDATSIIDDLSRDPRVASVRVDERVQRTAFPSDPPDDPYWTGGSLWGLYGTYGLGIASDSSTMGSVWTGGQGEGTVVAVIDTGYTAHPDLNDNYVAGYDFVSSGSSWCRSSATSFDGDYVSTSTYGPIGWDDNPLDPGDWTDIYILGACNVSSSSWHGTHVAGTIAAVGNNAEGIIGVAPKAKIQPIRALSMDGGFTSDILSAITWASGGSVEGVPANPTPADVINLSLGGGSACNTDWQTAIDAAVARGSVVVVSAGNSNADVSGFSPAGCDNVITVAASTTTGARASFSNYGTGVEITAPGSGIWSTLNAGSTLPEALPVDYSSYSGTSMAAPHVSGVAALVKQANPTYTPAQVLASIQTTSLTFPTGTGRDCTTSTCGSGLLQAGGSTTTKPVITGITPTGGSVNGGDSVTVSGYNLNSPSSVTLAAKAGTVTASSATSLTFTTPTGSAGTVDLAVTNGSGTTTYPSSFTYYEAPSVTSIDTSSGSTAGGDWVTLSGTNLSPVSSVTFGGSGGSIVMQSSTWVLVSTPARAAGTVDVTLTTLGGSSTLTGAFTFTAPATPPAAPAPPSGGSSSSSGGGGGGSQNEITAVSPSAAGAPGTVVAFTGWGLATTRAVSFNDYPASFSVVSDGHLEVTVPNIPTGNYVVHAQLAPEVGRASYWPGFTVLAPGSSLPVSGSDPGSSADPGSASGGPDASSRSLDFMTFTGSKTKLTKATRAKLADLAQTHSDASYAATIVTYTNAKETKKSVRTAEKRARNMKAYLQRAGFEGPVTMETAPADTAIQRRGALISVAPASNATSDEERPVSAIIVRLKKGRSLTVDGEVRGSEYVRGVDLIPGRGLGLRMYRVDLSRPVSAAQASTIAEQIAKDPGVAFAVPDSIVSAQPGVGVDPIRDSTD